MIPNFLRIVGPLKLLEAIESLIPLALASFNKSSTPGKIELSLISVDKSFL
ncbi:Uncharacterised protein [Mycoplasmopsis edwardii]|uniref:Uncharacterized protein n=1 Tax=Mycoplasmopsis edwardii TaxID=53558 RepID=A0A3B0PJE0_9BACT|nr:Uncharacterised protein [Mycoplasmopsis edwardii]